MIRPECFSELWTVNFTSVSVFFCPLGWKRMACVASGWVFPFSHLQGYSWLELSISQVTLRWVVVVQSVICVWLYATPWTAAHQTSLSFTISQSLLRLMSIESVMPSNHLILCHHTLPPAFNLAQHLGLFQWVSSSHQVAKLLKLQHQSFQWIFRVDFL